MNEFLFGVLKMSGTRESWWLLNIVNMLTAIEFFTLKWHFLKSLTELSVQHAVYHVKGPGAGGPGHFPSLSLRFLACP